MKLITLKRLVLSGLLAIGVAGGTVAPLMAGHASAQGQVVCEVDQHDHFLCWVN